MIEQQIQQIRNGLQSPLPGVERQLEMASMGRGERWEIREDHRKSGVLALFYPWEEQLHLVFMKRTQDGNVHSGQISFPGGKMEPTDANATATALREAEEELNIPQTEVQVLGKLTELYIPPSNFMVYPTVGFLPRRPHFLPSLQEVAQIIEVPLGQLLDPQQPQLVSHLVRPEMKRDVPAYYIQGHVIWGATGMMLHELLAIVKTSH